MAIEFNPLTGKFDITQDPGGSQGQLQYYNDNNFAGVPNTSVDPATGNTTFSARWINARNSAADAPADTMTGTWFTGGTSTTTKPHFLIEPAGTTSNNWSTAGTGFGVNAPSIFAGNLLDLQVGGASRWRIDKDGYITGPSFGSSSTFGLYVNGTTGGFAVFNQLLTTEFARLSSEGVSSIASFRLGATINGADVILSRGAANTLAQRNGTNAQTYWLFNTFTSDTNFERLNIRWASNEAIIDTEAGSGGGTLRGLKIGSASTSLLGFYGATPVARGAAVADATDAATVITQLNALLARVRAVGLIAT